MLHTSKIYFPLDTVSYDSADIVLLGVPLDSTASSLPGQRFGPLSIRRASFDLELFDMETETDLSTVRLHDAGDLHVVPGNIQETLERVEETIAEYRGKNVVVLGGEHSITYPAVKAVEPEAVVSLDAHFDLRDTYLGEKFSHACVMRRIYELGVQEYILGVRQASKEEYAFIKDASIDTHIPRGKKIYLSIDMDVFDCEHVGNYVPGGMTFSEGVSLVKKIIAQNEILGFDICEVRARTVNRTSLTAANLLYKILRYMRTTGSEL